MSAPHRWPGGDGQPPEGVLEPPVTTTVVFTGEIVRLRISEYHRPSGLRVRREVLDHNGAVVMVPIEEDHLLMVRQPREAVEEIMLELPAGKLDSPDEDPLEAARRELGEEVGRDAGIGEAIRPLRRQEPLAAAPPSTADCGWGRFRNHLRESAFICGSNSEAV